MPTPESDSFKDYKPTVPPTFTGIKPTDDEAIKAAKDAIVREQWVGVMMRRLVQQKLTICYRREGLNHLEKCGYLRERYLQLLEQTGVRGYLFEQRNGNTERTSFKSSVVESDGGGVPRRMPIS